MWDLNNLFGCDVIWDDILFLPTLWSLGNVFWKGSRDWALKILGVSFVWCFYLFACLYYFSHDLLGATHYEQVMHMTAMEIYSHFSTLSCQLIILGTHSILCSLVLLLFLPLQKDLPLRLYFGNGPRIHSRMCIEYGVVNKRCEDCGQVGKLTCFSSSFRKWVCN